MNNCIIRKFLPFSVNRPRDAMHKRGLCRRAVSACLPVRVSVTFVYSVQTNKHILKLFSPFLILVFPYQMSSWQYSGGEPLMGTSNAGGVGKIAILDKYPAIGSTTAGVRSTTDGRPCSLPHRPPRISESCLSQSTWTTTTKRREQNRICRQR